MWERKVVTDRVGWIGLNERSDLDLGCNGSNVCSLVEEEMLKGKGVEGLVRCEWFGMR